MYRGTHCDAQNPAEMFAMEVKKAIDAAHANGRKVGELMSFVMCSHNLSIKLQHRHLRIIV